MCERDRNKECNVMYHNIHDSHQACRKVYLKSQSWINLLVLDKIVNDYYCLAFSSLEVHFIITNHRAVVK